MAATFPAGTPCALRFSLDPAGDAGPCDQPATLLATYGARSIARFGQGPALLAAQSFPCCPAHGQALAALAAAEGWTLRALEA